MPSMNKEFFTHLLAGGYSPKTAKLRRHQLEQFEHHLGRDISTATVQEIEAYIVNTGHAREYKRSLRSCFSTYFSYLQARGLRSDNPAGALPRIKAMAPCPHPASDIAYYGAKRAAAPRELLMLRFAAEAGLRRSEVAQIHEHDFFGDLGGISLLVHGKGSKLRTVPLSNGLATAALARLKKQGGGYLFPGGVDGHLGAERVGKLISDLLPDGVSMHALRHRFATKAYNSTHNLFATQRLLGHASPVTTQLYVATDAQQLREVAMAAAA
ncbi:MAG: tyrosine-type recombinase/integrase [Arcanobacterium sp.]|nr:tyrosine-type recombinase/integrase [Arcanobacterium sp.]